MPDRLRRVIGYLAILAALTCAGCSARVDVPPEAVGEGPTSEVTATPEPGVPEGVRLTPSRGVDVREDGAVLEGLDIDGCVRVFADDVTILNTRIRCDDRKRKLVVQVVDDAEGLVIEASEVSGEDVVEVGVGWGRYTLRHVDIHSVNDGARFGSHVTIEDSWIHDMSRQGDLHADALQTTSGSRIVIRRNVLDPTDTETGDLNNAGLMMGSELGAKAVRDVVVEGNTFDGGNYSLNIRGDITAEGVVIRNNTFGSSARYGPVIAPESVRLGPGNTEEISGDPVRAEPAQAG